MRINPDDKWIAARLELSKPLSAQNVNHYLRAINERKKRSEFNLLVVDVNNVDADLSEAMRLGQFLAELKQDKITTVAILNESSTRQRWRSQCGATK